MLAINGGTPVRNRPWSAWPIWDQRTLDRLGDVLRSGRWAVSGPWTGQPSRCAEAERAFAEFNRARYCVTTANGSSALLTSLEALNIGPGDEVIVPALTWVATAIVVCDVNATPVIVDIDPDTYCISVDAVRAAITPRTRAVIPVHLYGCTTDMDGLVDVCRQAGIHIVEDCSHAHGSMWGDRYVGTIGDLGAFSLQQGKVLTAGEGGVVLTGDERLYRRVVELRSNSRVYTEPRGLGVGEMELVHAGTVMGSNYCLSEFQAALLLDQLERLEDLNRRKEENALYLDAELARIEGMRPMLRHPRVTQQSYYRYCVRVAPDRFAGRSTEAIGAALRAELGFLVERPYPPVHQSPLYRPQTKQRYRWSDEHWASLATDRYRLPVAERAFRNEGLVLHHSILIGGRDDMDDIVRAFEKVQRLADQIPNVSPEPGPADDLHLGGGRRIAPASAIRAEEAPAPPRWPRWPVADETSERTVLETLRSGRWTVRGNWTGHESKEIEFCRRFAEYSQRRFCALVASGTAALQLALEAFDIGPGDEVVVPALTWIAPLTAVLEAGATPVLVDVDPATGCIDPGAVRRAITPRTRALIAVHLHCSVADLDALGQLAAEHDLTLIEDGSQAHGAWWGDRPVGAWGTVGVFSLNQEKLLACGEGGAIVLDDPAAYERIVRMKTSGCMIDPSRRALGAEQLVYEGALLGSSHCASELQAALLLSQLERLEERGARRAANATLLDARLRAAGGLEPIARPARVTRPAFYEYGVLVAEERTGGRPVAEVCDALSRRLGFSLHPTDRPIYRNGFFVPGRRRRFRYYEESEAYRSLGPDRFPACERIWNRLIVFHHSVLLAEPEQMNDIALAFGEIGAALSVAT